ncbi:unnamed protein product [Moneuplotes crassus]|uniref:Uncharacterized protein n=1 Tax=Euplotes crassus TaxID=5936 RepID=A0AAD1XPT4_EUPCR|nr:unnamed protein product [Moneuplotes crassus]
MGNVSCYCELDNSKEDQPVVPLRFRSYKREPETSVSPKESKKPAIINFEGSTVDSHSVSVDVSELSCDFGIKEGIEIENTEKGNEIQVNSKLIPNNLSSFLQSVQSAVASDENSNNYVEGRDRRSLIRDGPIGTPISLMEENRTPKVRRTFPVLLAKDMSTVSIGRSKKILYAKLQEMGLIKPCRKYEDQNSCFCH